MRKIMACLVVLAATGIANAGIITYSSRASFDAAFPKRFFQGWDSFSAGTQFPDGTTNGGITYNSAGAAASVVTNAFLTTTSPNGLGDGPGQFFAGNQSMTFTFGESMYAFGIDINTFANTDGAYTVTTDNGDVIGSFFNPFPGFGTGQFVGFYSDKMFKSVTITPTTGFTYTLDSMRYANPEPLSIVVFGGILAAGGLTVRRRMKATA